MRRTMCRSKIHRATVTGADPGCEGSTTLDPVLTAAAELADFEPRPVFVDGGHVIRPHPLRESPGAHVRIDPA